MNDLPPGWAWARLDEIAEVRLGRQRSPKNHSGDNMRPYLRAANVDWNGLKLDDVKQMNFTDDEARVYRLQPGDIVLGEASGSPSEVGKPALWNGEIEDCCFQNTLLRVRSYGPEPRYLLHFLRAEALRGGFVAHSRGVGIRHLGASRLASWPVPIPPLAEQRRIVVAIEDHLSLLEWAASTIVSARSKLDGFMRVVYSFAVRGGVADLCPTYPAFIDQLAKRRHAIWLDSNPSKSYKPPMPPDISLAPLIPEGWAITSLEAITDPLRTIRYGILMPRVTNGGTVPYIEVKDLAGGTLQGKQLHRTSSKLDEQFSGARLAAGDVVMAIRGSYERSAVVPPEMDGANISRDVARISPLPGVSPDYIHTYLQSAFAQSYFGRHARGVAVKGINLSALRRLPIVLPTLEVQRRITQEVGAQISTAENLNETLKTARFRANTLRRSLLREAFMGRLLPHDPKDEPASELLAWIRAERAGSPVRRTRGGRTPNKLAPPVTTVTTDDFRQGELPL
ncbi:MAG TPA: restriction endonuclease subunit S [Micromonosporaceae bacterium]|nr:restriction endonuclease subunit S [Micromonosporaceae bacterium]